MTQPHRSEPDQGDSRARFLAAIPEFEGRTLKLSVVEEEIAWHFWQASEQRSAGAVGEPVAWRIDYPIDNSIGQTRFFGHREQMERAIQWNPGAVAVPLYAAPTADTARLDWLDNNWGAFVQHTADYVSAETDLRAAIDAARGNHD